MNDIKIINEYTEKLTDFIEKLPKEELEKALNILRKAYENDAQIFTMGNGGSAATAEHLAADFEKNSNPGGKPPRIISLSNQAAKILAYGNDISFDSVFSEQLKALGKSGDVAVMISASGNSPNIIKALEFAKERGITVIGLSGFSGGKLKELSDISLHFPCDSYEMTEDLHSMVCHLFVLCIRENK